MNDLTQKQDLMKHIDNDVEYPASKQMLVEACNKMSDVPAEDKKWFEDNLPDKTFNSPEEVKQALSKPM
jgi:hypothetical protein